MGGAEDRRDEARRAKRRLGGSDNRGTYTYSTTGRGKNRERRKVYTPHAVAKYKGTKGFDYKGEKPKGEKFVAGANVLDKRGKVAKRKSFDKYVKGTGNRADDPRNWEFHYKAPTSRYSTRGKDDHRVDNVAAARGRAERTARKTGREVFDVQKIEYETQGIIQDTEASGAKARAISGSGFGSTAVASNVAAQKQRGRRGRGGGGARRGAFDAQTQTRTSRIA